MCDPNPEWYSLKNLLPPGSSCPASMRRRALRWAPRMGACALRVQCHLCLRRSTVNSRGPGGIVNDGGGPPVATDFMLFILPRQYTGFSFSEVGCAAPAAALQGCPHEGLAAVLPSALLREPSKRPQQPPQMSQQAAIQPS